MAHWSAAVVSRSDAEVCSQYNSTVPSFPVANKVAREEERGEQKQWASQRRSGKMPVQKKRVVSVALRHLRKKRFRKQPREGAGRNGRRYVFNAHLKSETKKLQDEIDLELSSGPIHAPGTYLGWKRSKAEEFKLMDKDEQQRHGHETGVAAPPGSRQKGQESLSVNSFDESVCVSSSSLQMQSPSRPLALPLLTELLENYLH